MLYTNRVLTASWYHMEQQRGCTGRQEGSEVGQQLGGSEKSIMHKSILIGALLLALFSAWLARWNFVVTSAKNYEVGYLLDRWTGRLYRVTGRYSHLAAGLAVAQQVEMLPMRDEGNGGTAESRPAAPAAPAPAAPAPSY